MIVLCKICRGSSWLAYLWVGKTLRENKPMVSLINVKNTAKAHFAIRNKEHFCCAYEMIMKEWGSGQYARSRTVKKKICGKAGTVTPLPHTPCAAWQGGACLLDSPVPSGQCPRNRPQYPDFSAIPSIRAARTPHGRG